MYCKNCGNYNDDGSAFCQSCGAALQQQPEYPVDGGPQTDRGGIGDKIKNLKISKPLLYGIIGGVAAAALIVVLLCALLGGQHSWKGAVDKAFNAIKNLDSKSYIQATMPDKYLDYVLEDSDMTKSEYFKEAAEDAKDAKDDMDSDELKMLKSLSWEITKSKKMDEDDLDALNERYDDRYDAGSDYFKEGKIVTVKIKYKLDGKTQSTKQEMRVVKADGKWYVLDMPGFGF